MSLISETEDRNDNRKDINPPIIQVAAGLPPTAGLTPANPNVMEEPPLPLPPAPQAETAGAISTLTDDFNTNGSVAPLPGSPGSLQTPSGVLPPEQAQAPQEVTEQAPVQDNTQPQTDFSVPTLERVERGTTQPTGMGTTIPEVFKNGFDNVKDEQLRRGSAIGATLDEADTHENYIPTIYKGGDYDWGAQSKYSNDLNTHLAGMAQRQAEQRSLMEMKPMPQTGTNPREMRPDSTKPFNEAFGGFLGNAVGAIQKQLVDNGFNPLQGKFGQAGNGFVGGILYGLGLPQNIMYGAAADATNARDRFMSVLPEQVRGLLNWNPLSAIEKTTGIDFPDVIQATPQFKGSHTINALRGAQFSAMDYESAESPVGFRQGTDPGVAQGKWKTDPTFWAGVGLDIILDPAGAVAAAMAPLKNTGRIGRVAAKVAEVAVDPLGASVEAGVHSVKRLAGGRVIVTPHASEIPKAPEPGRKMPTTQELEAEVQKVNVETRKPPTTQELTQKVQRVEVETKAPTQNAGAAIPAKSEVRQAVPTNEGKVKARRAKPSTQATQINEAYVHAPAKVEVKQVVPTKKPISVDIPEEVKLPNRTPKKATALDVPETPTAKAVETPKVEVPDVPPAQAKLDVEIREAKLSEVSPGVVVETTELQKVATAALVREQAELLRLKASVVAEVPPVQPVVAAEQKLTKQQVSPPAEVKPVEVKTTPAKVTEAVSAQEQKVAEVQKVVESIPPSPQPSSIPQVEARVFQGEMTVSEVTQLLSDNVPGTQVDGAVLKKSQRTLPQILSLMKITMAPDGKPLVSGELKRLKTWSEVSTRLQARGAVNDRTYQRLFDKEGAPIPTEALQSDTFRIVMDKPKNFRTTPSVVVDNTPKVQAPRRDALQDIPLAQNAVDPQVVSIPGQPQMRVSRMAGYDSVQKANSSKNFRDTLVKERNKIARELDDETLDEKSFNAKQAQLEKIDQELHAPDVKANPGHLEQLQKEVIPDEQRGISPEVVDLTQAKLDAETELKDLSSHVQLMERDLEVQELALEQALTKIDDVADMGRKDLAVGYKPESDQVRVLPDVFEKPENVRSFDTGAVNYMVDDTDLHLFNEVQPLITEVMSEFKVNGGVDIVLMSPKMAENLNPRTKAALKNVLFNENTPAYTILGEKTVYLNDHLFTGETRSIKEIKHIIRHELGHIMQERSGKTLSEERKAWKEAMKGKPVSARAASADGVEMIDEDFAESVAYYKGIGYRFAQEAPERAAIVEKVLQKEHADFLNSQTFFHGTRVQDWTPNHDPLTGGRRAEWGQGTYLTSDEDIARAAADSTIADNIPDVETRMFGDGSVHEVKLNVQKPLDVNELVTPNVQAIFESSMRKTLKKEFGEEALWRKKAVGMFTSNSTTIKKPDVNMKVSELWSLMETSIHKHGTPAGANISEEFLSDLYRNINTSLRKNGYDAISDGKTVALLDGQKGHLLNSASVPEADAIDVAVARYNLDSAVAADNPSLPSAQVNFMESNIKLQAQVVEDARTKLIELKRQQTELVEKVIKADGELEEAAKLEKHRTELMKQSANKEKNAESFRKLNKATTPCEF